MPRPCALLHCCIRLQVTRRPLSPHPAPCASPLPVSPPLPRHSTQFWSRRRPGPSLDPAGPALSALGANNPPANPPGRRGPASVRADDPAAGERISCAAAEVCRVAAAAAGAAAGALTGSARHRLGGESAREAHCPARGAAGPAARCRRGTAFPGSESTESRCRTLGAELGI
jgi:hypothetical protein